MINDLPIVHLMQAINVPRCCGENAFVFMILLYLRSLPFSLKLQSQIIEILQARPYSFTSIVYIINIKRLGATSNNKSFGFLRTTKSRTILAVVVKLPLFAMGNFSPYIPLIRKNNWSVPKIEIFSNYSSRIIPPVLWCAKTFWRCPLCREYNCQVPCVSGNIAESRNRSLSMPPLLSLKKETSPTTSTTCCPVFNARSV